jgi:uncharacterized protein
MVTPAGADAGTTAVKILVVGPFGVGKTTLVTAVSEIRPLRTEERLTRPSAETDCLAGVEGKTTTTVAVDFGRLTLERDLTLYVFGTPGQDRFWFLWEGLTHGAIGAVVLVDTRRLESAFPTIDYVEQRRMPFVIAVNVFEGARYHYSADEIRDALDLAPHVPVVWCDARDRSSATTALAALVRHAITRHAHVPSPRIGAPA